MIGREIHTLFREMRSLGRIPNEPERAGVAATLLIPVRNAGPELLDTVRQSALALDDLFGTDHETILIPNPGDGKSASQDQSLEFSRRLEREFPRVRVCPHLGTAGKGAALRTGFLQSRGAWIFFTDADLPYDLSFFARAADLLRSGFDFVAGNRRLAESQFEVPVTLLPLAYGRHRLGLWFNQLVRSFLGIRTTDTQAGIKAMTREFAAEAFRRQTCPGFFFDIEFFLTCKARGYRHSDLTVELFLRSEKSTVSVIRQSILAGVWLARIAIQNLTGAYGDKRKPAILRRFSGAEFGTKLFLLARWRLTPYARIAEWLPRKGKILDLGSGHGLLSLWMAETAPERLVLGIDHDERRVELANSAAGDLKNISFKVGPVLPMPEENNFAGITMIDVFHYFTPAEQTRMTQAAFERLQPGGLLLVREVEPDPSGFARIVGKWNRIYEKLATSIGFTRSEQTELTFRSRAQWEELFRQAGFAVHSEPCSSPIFSDILFVCKKPLQPSIAGGRA